MYYFYHYWVVIGLVFVIGSFFSDSRPQLLVLLQLDQMWTYIFIPLVSYPLHSPPCDPIVRQHDFYVTWWRVQELTWTLIKFKPVQMGWQHSHPLSPQLSLLWDALSYLIHLFMRWLSQLHNKGSGWFSTEKHRTAAKCSTPWLAAFNGIMYAEMS